MSFEQSTFAPVGAHSSDTPNLFSYKTNDLTVQVIQPNYFFEKRNQLEVGDFMLIQAFDGSIFAEVDSTRAGVNEVSKANPTTAFNELSVAQPTPITQITAQYGLLSDVLTVNLGGTTTTQDSKFVCSTGTGPNNVSAIVSSRQAQYKAGQGLLARFTAIFTQGVSDSTQQSGFITSESAFGFGYNGTEFGILHARDGVLENQELTVASGATGNENATVTVDGVGYTVALTIGSVEKNAYEIATSLSAQVPGYGFSSTADKVYALAQLPDFGAGTFLFSSATAVASWSEISSGTLPTETWVKKADWNINPDIDIDPTKGNVYQIQIQYLGFGAIRFFAENTITGILELVHMIRYANTSLVPSVPNPIFRIGWAARNNGNTSDIVVQGASGAAFLEGKISFDFTPTGICQTQLAVGTTRTNIISLKNRLTFNGVSNRAEIIPISLGLSSDTTKTAFFELVANPEVAPGDFLEYNFFDEQLSLMETATNKVEITGGDVIACFSVAGGNSLTVDMEKILKTQSPGLSVSITARISGGNASQMDVSPVWGDDL